MHRKVTRGGANQDRLDASPVLERIGWVPLACLIGAIVLASVAGITWNTSPYYGRNDKVQSAAKPQAVPVQAGKYLVTLAPNRIDIPTLRASAPIVDVGTTPDRELEIPVNPRIAGWWSPGAQPGAKVGTAIIAGHINYAGVTGTFANIGKLHPGDIVNVYGKQNATKAMVEFKVTGVRNYKKTALPYQQIFDQKSVGRLALVTCGGAFDTSTGSYLENIVVFAVPVTSKTL
ncbi:MAG: class F sortase [Jatrophihabitans sp.]